MSSPRSTRTLRMLAGTHLLQAAALLGQPGRVADAVSGGVGTVPSWIMRVLGIRIATQAAVELLWPGRTLLRFGVGVDLTHAASMLAAAQLLPVYRRAALASAAAAAVSAASGAVTAQRWQ